MNATPSGFSQAAMGCDEQERETPRDGIDSSCGPEASRAAEMAFDYPATRKALDDALEELSQAREQLAELSQYFQTGSGIPIERAVILAEDFWRIVGKDSALAAQQKD